VSDPDLVVFPQLQWQREFASADSAAEGSRNCACAVGAGIVSWATRGVDKPSHHEFRKRAGEPVNSNGEPVGLSSRQVFQAYESYVLGVSRHFGASFALVRDALQAGHAVSLCIDYRFINETAPDLSGQKTFKTGHHVALLGWIPNDPQAGGANTTVVHDPLFDGRTKPWGTAPLGPQRAQFSTYRGAMGAFHVNGATYALGTPIGDGAGVFLVVKRNPPLAVDLAAIGPTPDVAQLAAQKADLEVKLREAEAQIARLRDHITKADAELDEAL
jgi:hypothetical protein